MAFGFGDRLPSPLRLAGRGRGGGRGHEARSVGQQPRMDFHGNNVHHIGYGHPRLKRAIAAQMDALPFAPRRYACAPAAELAEKLAAITPGRLSRVLFTTGGSDAV